MKTAGIAAALMLLCASAAGIWAQGRPGKTAGNGFLEAVWPGVSRSDTEVTLSSKLDENIVRVAVEEGQLVKKGDVLIEFDARLLSERIGIAEIETDFTSRLEAARVRHEYLAEEYNKSASLLDDGGVTGSELNKARFEMDMAKLDREELARSKMLADQNLRFYKTQAKDYVILSPIDGAVSQVWVEEAEMASQGQQLIGIIDPNVIEVRVHLPEQYVKDVLCGQGAMVKFPAAGDREFPGTIHIVSPYVDSSSGVFTVEILVEPGIDAVKPGMGCEVRFLPCEQA